MKKIMIISDIHGSYDDLKQVISLYNKHHCNQLIILGDILYHGPRNDLPEGYNPKKCITLLNQYKDEIIAVRGNCDAEVDQMVLEFPMRSDYLLYNIDEKTSHHFIKVMFTFMVISMSLSLKKRGTTTRSTHPQSPYQKRERRGS